MTSNIVAQQWIGGQGHTEPPEKIYPKSSGQKNIFKEHTNKAQTQNKEISA